MDEPKVRYAGVQASREGLGEPRDRDRGAAVARAARVANMRDLIILMRMFLK